MEKGIKIISDLMTVRARTVPKASGESYMDIALLDDAEREILAEEMYQLSDELNDEDYSKYGKILEEDAQAVLLISLKEHPPLGLNCRACGFDDCDEFKSVSAQGIFRGPNCIYRLLDMGMALGSALDTASVHKVKASVMIKAGLAAKNIGLSTANVCIAVPVILKEDRPYL
ncbi:MAG: DUF2148 domain-containing protein [Thermoplasmata archaeon]